VGEYLMEKTKSHLQKFAVTSLTKSDEFLLQEIAKKWNCGESRIISIALHDWLKTNFHSYE
jgi:hypothetical protein